MGEDDKPKFHSKEALQTLRRCFDLEDEDDIAKCYLLYTKAIELFRAYGQTEKNKLKKKAIIDWCLPAAICPEWYESSLIDRLNNTMLVSALLITVTAVNVFDPPDSFESKDQHSYRAFVLINLLATFLFLFSIFFGIFFIENAMSRSYGKIERLVLIKEFYSYKDICQVLMAIGVAIFPFACTVAGFNMMTETDQWIATILSSIYVVGALFVLISLSNAANGWMIQRVEWMEKICDDRGHLLEKYQPVNPDMTPDDFKEIYGGDCQSMKKSLHAAGEVFTCCNKNSTTPDDKNIVSF